MLKSRKELNIDDVFADKIFFISYLRPVFELYTDTGIENNSDRTQPPESNGFCFLIYFAVYTEQKR